MTIDLTSCDPWEKFILATHIPFSMSLARVCTLLHAGPVGEGYVGEKNEGGEE